MEPALKNPRNNSILLLVRFLHFILQKIYNFPSICYNMRYLVCSSCDPSGNFDMVYLKKALKIP